MDIYEQVIPQRVYRVIEGHILSETNSLPNTSR
jgi:hypothetical protein